MDKKTLDSIDTMYKCCKCGKFKDIKNMVKIPKKSLISLIQKTQEYKVVCKECVQEWLVKSNKQLKNEIF